MARKKVKTVKSHEMIDRKTEELLPEYRPAVVKYSGGGRKWWYIGVLVVILAILFFLNKGLLLAAIVDGRPIFSWELNRMLTSRFGKQTLEGIISEKLIAKAAQKQGIKVTQTEIDTKIADIVKGLGGNVNIDDLLKYQGLTKSDFESQIRLQLTVAKVLGKDITVGDSDIDGYIQNNRASLTATTEAEMREQAKNAIFDQKIGEKLQPWFLELKQKSKIFRFI